ncbi:MAG: ribosomal-protein-alanine N-acetyltransferase, partial [Oscillospiraceae bacterium]|nr:ribosomal-protein-alanine N-acetyltransferase [Oscillospiraceae bacterium]
MKPRIVPMTARRLSAVAELERVCFPADPWSEALYQAALDNPAVAILLALGEDGALLGYAVLSPGLDEGHLDTIAVAPDCRR